MGFKNTAVLFAAIISLVYSLRAASGDDDNRTKHVLTLGCNVITSLGAASGDDDNRTKHVLTLGCNVITGADCCKAPKTKADVVRPTSCLDYLIKGASKCGIYRLYDNTGNSFPAYCYLKSEPGTAWTLVMSWSTQYRSLPALQRTPFKINAPVNENSHNWNQYCLSLTRMRSMQSHSTHWRATCSYPTHGVDFTDYVRGTFKDLNIIDYSGNNLCKRVEYINIRGHTGILKTVPFWQGSKAGEEFLHTDSGATTCEFKANSGSVYSEDNFGLYRYINHKFRCTRDNNSSTQWWFGAHL
ncbi:uncharacterized protein [Montipora foliosa]|uniref:uncharacterized protein isoform X1 n=1 Tax=Montipora foliosa TaxID=591990 RepID=UPI0035F123A1